MLPNFPVITSNLAIGLGVFGTADPFNGNLQNNGALNPLGGIYYLGPGEGGLQALGVGAGGGSGLWVKYVKYKSTDATATKTGPAPVYWTDESYTVVTDIQSESQTATVNSVAGWLLPNTTATGAGFTIAALNNGGLGSYVFIGLQGWISQCFIGASTTKGFGLIGSGTAWTPALLASATTAPTSKMLGYALQTIANGATTLSDVEANLPLI